MSGPLEGITVIELAQQYPGPFCSRILADLGAEVIKVEHPKWGDPARGLGGFFSSINRNKKSLTVDLKTERGPEVVRRLAQEADIVLEGWRPGVAEGLGVGYEELSEENPRLVYCSISGFGQTGPYRDRPGHDLDYVAIGGLLGISKYRGRRPPDPDIQFGDLSSGLFAAIAVLSALQAREKEGRGQYIDLSMLDSVVTCMSTHLGMFQGETNYEGGILAINPTYDIFEAADGEYLTLGIAHEDHFWRRLCELLEFDDLKDANIVERLERRQEISRRLKNAFSKKDADEWVELMLARDIPCAKVNDLKSVLGDEQLLHREMIVDVNEEKQTGVPMKFSDTPGSIRLPPPNLGEHTNEILERIGYSRKEIDSLRADGTI